jgi:hypothetical protein
VTIGRGDVLWVAWLCACGGAAEEADPSSNHDAMSDVDPFADATRRTPPSRPPTPPLAAASPEPSASPSVPAPPRPRPPDAEPPPLHDPTTGSEEPPAPAPITTGPSIATRYAWYDANELAVFDEERHLWEVDASFSTSAIEATIAAFGIHAEDRRFREGEEAAHAARLRNKQVLFRNGRTIEPDHAAIVAAAAPHLAPLARSIVEQATAEGRGDRRSVAGILTGLVQDGLPYAIPADIRRSDAGGPVVTLGLMVPLEALTARPSEARAGWGWGDCDTKSLTFAAVAQNIEGLDVVLLSGRHHMFVGVSLPPQVGDRYVKLRGETYVLVELTAPWPLGQVPPENVPYLREFEVIPL